MPDVELARADWTEYFAALSAQGAGARASVHVLPDASGTAGRRRSGWRLYACAYDAAAEVLQLELSAVGREDGGLRFFFAGPRAISARESQDERAILILDSDAVHTLGRLRSLEPRRSRVSASTCAHTREHQPSARRALAAGGAR